MAILVSCRKHPAYMAKRKPNCECATCWMIWKLIGELIEMADGNWRLSYRTRLTEKRR